MNLAIISANLGGYDVPHPWPVLDVPAGVELSIHRFTDENVPPRTLAMTSRLQCGLPKWFGWQFAPGRDVYIWIDASCIPTAQAVPWFLEKLGRADMAVFAHPHRRTVKQEYEFMKARMARPGEAYLNSRYKGEWLDEEYAASVPLARLVASTAFVYRPTGSVSTMLERVWLHKTRYHLHDQLAFSSAVAQYSGVGNVAVNWIPDNYLHCSALQFVRKRR